MKILLISLMTMSMAAHAEDTSLYAKAKEKAKFDLIKNLENLVNLEECEKDIHSPDLPADALPRSCNKVDYFAKYFFTKNDVQSINDYIAEDQKRIFSQSREIMQKYKIKSLGKMVLSNRCIINNRPVDLDQYISRIKNNDLEVVFKDEGNETRSPAQSKNKAEEKLPEIGNHN